MSNPYDYTVGWICAIRTEYVAAQELLDGEHDHPESISTNDPNDYTLGRLGKHNVVIAVLPDGEYGTSSAASVAAHMLRSFPNVRIGLMVGIGGGAPSSKHDIRLGDIVVSAPRDGESGVFEYDFGKTIQGRAFHYTRSLNMPPISLRTAVAGIQAQYERKGHQLPATINGILEKNRRLQRVYKRPAPESDRLFRSDLSHDACGCTESCVSDPLNLVPRRARTNNDDDPAIHYGLIASANQLMKDATIRDKLAMERDVLCFEMEAAGLMNPFPCLVIRGICDYADSHKNKEWQGYAAMVAAAYAKDLLSRITPNKVEAEKKLADVILGLHNLAEEHIDVAKQQLQVHKDQVEAKRVERLTEEERRCHQLFRLTTGNRDATYEWYKTRVEDRLEGTCLWFLRHKHFQSWLKHDSGPLLVSADPGCGKSVLAKYLIDHVLPKSASICYFFFKDDDQNTCRQALCALLHQLFEQKPLLIRHAMAQYHKDGQGLINSTESLWKVLREAVNDPEAGPVIMVLDALDECAELELEGLIRNVEEQFRNNISRGKLKYLLTSRPYDQIVARFQDLLQSFPNIRVPGEDESEAISQEVNQVITHRTMQLSIKEGLSPEIKSHLERRLLETTHRTYLWVYLVFNYLENEGFKKTIRGVESTIRLLPRSVNEAYENILNKSKEDPIVRKILSIILAASRPLTLAEMNVAINIDKTVRSVWDLDLENEKDLESRLRSWCGLFISISHGKIYFLHQTAREFLLANSESTVIVPSRSWQHSITIHQAHSTLTELCVLYLNLLNLDGDPPTYLNEEARFAFLDYSAKNWGAHFHETGTMDDAAIVDSVLQICDPFSESHFIWYRIYWQTTPWHRTRFTSLMVASYFGLDVIVKLCLKQGANVNDTDPWYHRTPLMWAESMGHEGVVKLLLDNGAEVDHKKNNGRSPLFSAAREGHKGVIKLLLERGAEINQKDNDGRSPLFSAAGEGHKDVVKLLLDNGAYVDLERNDGRSPLFSAAGEGHKDVVKLLLERGAGINHKDIHGNSPLLKAAVYGQKDVVKLLLDNGAETNHTNIHGDSPLLKAAVYGQKDIVKLLLDNGAEINHKNNHGDSPLLKADVHGQKDVVKLLLDRGAVIDFRRNPWRSSRWLDSI